MLKLINRILKSRLDMLIREVETNRILLAQERIGRFRSVSSLASIQEAEFKVFSQWGDDGIIQFLIGQLGFTGNKHKFVEFGVENYRESNTRFLLVNNNWSGFVLDGDIENINYIQKDAIYWKHDLLAKQCFITCENINQILEENKFAGDIELFHIDIDGNDYWIWDRLEVCNPCIMIVEYNSLFGSEHAVSIPYDPTFYRSRAHFSNLYYGASLRALVDLGIQEGYSFIGSNSAGNNAYFMRNQDLGLLQCLSVEEGYVEAKYRESRDDNGNLTFLNGRDRLQAIRHLPIVDLKSNQKKLIGDYYGVT